MNRKALISLTALAFVSSGVLAQIEPATMNCFGPKKDDCRMTFSGDVAIDRDLHQFLEHLDRSGKKITFVMLDSNGGDVDAALAIGRLFRKHSTAIAAGKCASACVLMAVGAVERSIFQSERQSGGGYGLHRPYRPRPTASRDEAQRDLARANEKIEAYLREMGIPVDLLTAMNVVSPQDIRWLSDADAQKLGLTRFDPAYEEYRQGQHASALGISRQELLKRLKRKERECDTLPYPHQITTESLRERDEAYGACMRRVGVWK